MSEESIYYTYAYLDPRKPGEWRYKDRVFSYRPFYIGKGKGERIDKHLQPNRLKGDTYKNATIEKIRKCGMEPIKVKIFENLIEDEAFILEESIIDHFGRKSNNTGFLTNMTAGGRGVKGAIIAEKTKQLLSKAALGKPIPSSKRINQFDLDKNLLSTWDTLMSASKGTGVHFSNISAATYSKSGKAKGYIWRFEGSSPYEKPEKEKRKLGKDVFKYTLKGHFVCSFESCKDAAESINLAPNGLIFRERSSIIVSRGYQWSLEYLGEKIESIYPFPEIPSFHNKHILFQYSLEGHLIQTFESFTHVSEVLNCSAQSIAQCAKGVFLQAYGFQWSLKYLGESIPSVKKYAQPKNVKKIYVYTLEKEFLEVIDSYNLAREKYGKFKIYDRPAPRTTSVKSRNFMFSYTPLL